MKKKKLNWAADLDRPVGKGYAEQHFTATAGDDDLVIETTPWGEGNLQINGKTAAHVEDDTSAYEVFRDLEAVAEELESDDSTEATDSK